MANTFLRKSSGNVSTTLTNIGGYTVGSNIGAIVLNVSVTNQDNQTVLANVILNNGYDNYYLLNKAPILGQSTLVAIGKAQKMVLQAGDSIKVNASGNISAYMSIMETDTVGLSDDPNKTIYYISSNLSPITANVNIGIASSFIQLTALSKVNSSQMILLYDKDGVGINSNIFTVSGTGITYNNDQTLYAANGARAVSYLSDNTLVTTFQSSYGAPLKSGVITVSANVATLGTLANLSANSGGYLTTTALSSSLAVCLYIDSTTSNVAAVAMSISGGTVTSGSALTGLSTISGSGLYISIAKLSSTSAIIGYRDGATPFSNFYVRVLSVSGTTITAGSPVLISDSYGLGGVSAVSSTSAVVVYETKGWGSGGGGYIRAQRLSVSGTTISLSGPAANIVANSAAAFSKNTITTISDHEYLYAFPDKPDPFPSLTTARMKAVVLTDEGTYIQAGNVVTVGPAFNDGAQNQTVAALMTGNLAVAAWQAANSDSKYYATPILITPT